MLPGEYPLVVYRSDTTQWQFVLWQDDAATIPTDLTGCTVKAEIRQIHSTTRAPVPLQCTIELPNIIFATLAADETRLNPARGNLGQWDLQLTKVDGKVQTILAGNVEVVGDITRLSA